MLAPFRRWAGKCLAKKKSSDLAFSSFQGVNTPIVAHSRQLICCHINMDEEEVCTNGAYKLVQAHSTSLPAFFSTTPLSPSRLLNGILDSQSVRSSFVLNALIK